jgi:hypothetical protein
MLEDNTRPRVRYDGKTEKETYRVATGRLRISLQTGYRDGPSLGDSDSRTLEAQLNHVFMAIYRLVVRVWQKDRQHREFERRLEEERRRHAEEARLRAEREEAVAKERARRKRLSSEAVRWAQCRRILEYVTHIRRTALERSVVRDELLENWTDWALRVASDLNPTDTRLANPKDGDGSA